MCFGGPSVSEPKVLAQPKENSSSVMDAAEQERKRRQAGKGAGNSILTSASGDTSAVPTTGKTLLGQ